MFILMLLSERIKKGEFNGLMRVSFVAEGHTILSEKCLLQIIDGQKGKKNRALNIK